jgi:hypothetical protein
VVVKGVDDILVRFGKCCQPVPGDPITGYITRGYGVTVHRTTCVNAMKLNPERQIEVEWNQEMTESYPVKIVVRSLRPGRFVSGCGRQYKQKRRQHIECQYGNPGQPDRGQLFYAVGPRHGASDPRGGVVKTCQAGVGSQTAGLGGFDHLTRFDALGADHHLFHLSPVASARTL